MPYIQEHIGNSKDTQWVFFLKWVNMGVDVNTNGEIRWIWAKQDIWNSQIVFLLPEDKYHNSQNGENICWAKKISG